MKCPQCLAPVPKSVLLGSDQKNFRCPACNVVLEIEDTRASHAIVTLLGVPALFIGALKSGDLSWPAAIGLWVGLGLLGFVIAYKYGRVRILRIPANLRQPEER